MSVEEDKFSNIDDDEVFSTSDLVEDSNRITEVSVGAFCQLFLRPAAKQERKLYWRSIRLLKSFPPFQSRHQ